MAVKSPMKMMPRLYSHKERKSAYFLRNSSFNPSRNSPPKTTSKLLSPSLNMINKDSTKKKTKEHVSTQVIKRGYSLRNSSINLSYRSPLKRTARNLEFTPNNKIEHSMRNKLKKRVYTQGRKTENSLRNSHSTVNHNYRQKRNANCIDYTPNTNPEHPMRKKLRKLAYISTPKNKTVIYQNLAIDKDLNSFVLTGNKGKVTSSISMKSLDSENALQSSKKSASSRISTRSIFKTTVVSEKCNKTSKTMKATHSSDSKDAVSVKKEKNNLESQRVKISNSVKSQLKDLRVRVVPLQEDILVSIPNYMKDAKGRAKTLKMKSSFETPVIKQNSSRNLRSKDNCDNLISTENIMLGYSPKVSISNRVTDNIICDQKDLLKVNYLDTVTPVNTRLKKRSCEVKYLPEKIEMAAVPKRGRKKKNSLNKSSTDARQSPCIDELEGNKGSSVKTSTQKKVGTDTGEESRFSAKYLPKKIEMAAVSKRGRKKKNSVIKTSTDARQSPCIDELGGNEDSSVKTRTQKKVKTDTVEGKEQVEFQRKTKSKVFEKNFESPIEKRITRSTTFVNKYELFPSDSFPKKSKRHTFPNSNKSSKSMNPHKMYSVDHFNNVPVDVLTQPATSFHESQVHTPKTNFVSVKKVSPKASLKTKKGVPIKSPVLKTSLKGKKTEVKLPKKTSGPSKKVPAVGTLKRKRWVMKTLKEKSEGHEDDIFENRKIEFPKAFAGPMISDDESDATDFSIATPVCGFLLTPNISRKSPLYKPCISSNDLIDARKVAEEYLYRRNKTWKHACKNFLENKAVTSENNQGLEKKTEYSEALADVLKAQADIEKLTQEESEEEDEYFSDVS